MVLSFGPQDRIFLSCLAKLGSLTNEHVQRLCYPNSKFGDKSARRRTKVWEREGIICSHDRKTGVGRRQKIWSINKKKKQEVSSLLGGDSVRVISTGTGFNIEHQLLVNSVIVEFIAACGQNKNYSCEFLTDLEGASDGRSVKKLILEEEFLPCWGKVSFIPDGVICLTNVKTGKKSLCFLEVDRGGTTLKKLGGRDKNVQTKISGYVSFWDCGNYKKYDEYFGCAFSGFRLLWITENQKRLESVFDLCVLEKSGDLVWFASLSEILEKGAFGEVWTVPGKNGRQKLVKESP